MLFIKFSFVFLFSSLSLAQFSSTSTDISSTTSGSVKKIFSQKEKERLQFFVDQNFERLQEAAARGSGIVLNDYVSLLGCQRSHRMMESAIQKNYEQLFGSGKSQLVERTEQLIEGSSKLARACEART